MKIDILTLFPNMFDGFLGESIIKRAIDTEKVQVGVHNIRDYAKDKHKRVDDTPYGGGAGMIMMCQPIFDAVESIRNKKTKVVLLTPQGVLYNQKLATTLSKEEHLIFLCGHYEGFDERVTSIVDMEISIGDYVLTGGELPSMVVADSVIRLLPGVIDDKAHQIESFYDNLLDHPNYTKPRTFKGMRVPDILLTGHHQNIDKWRQTERIIKTMQKRPDLITKKVTYCLVKDARIGNIAIINLLILDGMDITPRNNAKRNDVISVTKMILIEPSFIKKVIKTKVEKKLKIFIERMHELDEDDDSTSAQLLIFDIEKYKKYLIDHYIGYVGLDYGDLIIKKIQLLLNELMIRKHLHINNSSKETRGRSM